ncbi:MAG TPA: helix-turn-helix domain-containing protein [Acidimicrobiales bacterium]|nr:helix-turn-helix domain-containing protein [Acidimicrobiales bacterium]
MPAAPDSAIATAPQLAEAEDARFASHVAAVTAAFGDPRRRDIFLRVRAAPGMTATEVASTFSLHPNVARHHLDRLVAGGYLRVETDRRPQGAGRPSKRFFPVAGDAAVEFLTRRDDLLVTLLGKALDLLGPGVAEQMAAEVGEAYGRSLVKEMGPGEGQRSVRNAMRVIADTLTAHGFAAHAEEQADGTAVVAEQCPFGTAAASHPVLCAVDRGMVKGLLSGLCGEQPAPVVLSSKARGDDTCAALA